MNPENIVRAWLDEARSTEPGEADAFQLATADASGRPSVRTVLLRWIRDDGWTFFTDYRSRKSQQMTENPSVAGVFCWKTLNRQVHVEGSVTRATEADSDEYFAQRPRGSQIGAWASHQSAPLTQRADLEGRVAAATTRFADVTVPRPATWGGWRIVPNRIELWEGRDNRLHDRTLFLRTAEGWASTSLFP